MASITLMRVVLDQPILACFADTAADELERPKKWTGRCVAASGCRAGDAGEERKASGALGVVFWSS